MIETLIGDSNFTRDQNLFRQNCFLKTSFESAYLDIRKKEGRIFSDADVKQLPAVDADHPQHREWKIRARSARRLLNYLTRSKQRSILEFGCGNGWLCHQLATIPGSEVLGLDVNELELQQASSVFKNYSNLAFILGDLFTIDTTFKVDVVVFASSLQYFPDAATVLRTAMNFLNSKGEIHIIDTPFYQTENVRAAKARSSEYFAKNDSNMNLHYFHHTFESLSVFSPTLLYDPASTGNRIKNKFITDSPFPWIRIKK